MTAPVPVHLEPDELRAAVACLRNAIGLDGPGRRAFSKLDLALDLALLAPTTFTRAVLVGDVFGTADGHGYLEPGDGYKRTLEALAAEAGARPTDGAPWRFGRFRVTLERLPEGHG